MAYPIYDNPILMGKPNELPYDIQTAQSSIQRKKLLVRKLLEASMQSGNLMDAGAYKVANWGDALGNVFQGFMGRKGLKEIDEEERKVAGEMSRIDKEAGDEFERASSDKKEVVKPMAEFDEEGNRLPGAEVTTKGDLKKAFMGAAQSKSPKWQKLGMEGLETFTKELAKARAEATKPYWSSYQGVVSRTSPDEEGRIQSQVNPTVQFGPMQGATADVPAGQYNLATNQYDTAGAGGLRPEPPGKQFNKELQGADVKLMGEGRDKAQKGFAGLKVVADVEKLVSNTPDQYFGTLSGARQFVNRLSSSLNLGIDPNAVSLENINSLLGERLLERLKMFAPVSNTDVENMKQIIGSTGNTKQALIAMLDYAAQVYSNDINMHQQFVQGLEGQEGYGDLSRYKVERSVKSAPNPAAVEAEMKRRGLIK